MEETLSPGLFHLPLPVNKKDVSKDAIKRKLTDIRHDLKARLGRPEELAIRNVIGLFNCILEQYKEALESFGLVLSKDECNLNALANKQYVLKLLRRRKEAKSFQDKLSRLLRQPAELGVSPPEYESRHQQHVRAKARCLAEQAYAYACNIHTDKDSYTREKYKESNAIFEKAIELAGDSAETREKDFWKFCMAKNAHKIFDSLSFGDNHLQAVDYMDKAVELFQEITQRDPGDSEYQWESWRHLADIFRKIKQRRHCSSAHLPRELKRFVNDPEECMKKAVEISPNNPRLLARYANFVYSQRRDTKEALRLLDKSIILDDGEYNFYAFSTRGTVQLKYYKWKLRRAKEDPKRCSPPDRHTLEMARGDMEKAIEFGNTVWDLLNLAEVYHLLAQCSTDRSSETRRQYLEKEFEYLKRATDCENGNKQTHVSRALGRCLFDLGDYREAVACFQEALDLESPTAQYTGYFHEQFRCYLCLMQSDPEDESFLEEMAQSLKKALTKYGASCLIRYCFGPLRTGYRDELRSFTSYCRTLPNSKDIVDLLTSQEPASPLSPPVRAGGTLREHWEDEPDSDQKTADVPGTQECASVGSSGAFPQENNSPDANSKTTIALARPTPDEQTRGAQDNVAKSLVSGITDMTINDTSADSSSNAELQAEAQGSTPSYDFIVVHAKGVNDWVHQHLLPEMKKRGVRGCTRHNDAIAGSISLRSELDLMKQSTCILLVVTEDFKQCEFLMYHALKLRMETGQVVVPVRRDGSRIPDEIQDVLNCFDATAETPDWDNLAKCIKRQIDAATSCQVNELKARTEQKSSC